MIELQETPMARRGPGYAIWAVLFRQVCGGLGVVWDEPPIISSETKKGMDLAFGLRDREVLNSFHFRGVGAYFAIAQVGTCRHTKLAFLRLDCEASVG